MDISTNDFDLLYLTNPAFLQNLNNKNQLINENTIGKKDFKKFKSRIFELTRDILMGKNDIDDSIKQSFNEYAKTCIKHFKFTDKSNIIQEDYKNYNNATINNQNFSNKTEPTNKKNYDNLIMNKKEKEKNLMEFVEITNKKKQDLIVPKIRKIKVKNKKKNKS
tara:strand:+ start:348 stop:839 length:492 start_codon:yes stop_codon:yes gene_type:complete